MKIMGETGLVKLTLEESRPILNALHALGFRWKNSQALGKGLWNPKRTSCVGELTNDALWIERDVLKLFEMES